MFHLFQKTESDLIYWYVFERNCICEYLCEEAQLHAIIYNLLVSIAYITINASPLVELDC